MAKDDLHSNSACPECNQQNRQQESVSTGDDCSCCSCSCSDASDTDEKSSDGSKFLTNMEKRKRDLLSSLSIRRTNQEPASIQHVLQFVEALTHSSEFFRRYNLLDDFCLDCLIHEPTYLCCSSAQQQDSNNSSCEECLGSTEEVGHVTQTCSECTQSAKPLRSRRQKAEARRDRRRRRRQRRGTPQIVVEHDRTRRQPQFAVEHDRTRRKAQDPTSSSRDCLNNNITYNSKSKSSANTSYDNCAECAYDKDPNHPLLKTCESTDSDASDLEQRCTHESKSCPISGCTDWVHNRRGKQKKSRKIRESNKNTDESCCSSCSHRCSNQSGNPGKSTVTRKQAKSPESAKQGKSSSTAGNEKLEKCSCDDCLSISGSSEDSCDDCKEHNLNKNSGGNKK